MSSLGNAVNKHLSNMHNRTGADKGSFGEEAVFRICEDFYQREGGILIHSYSYKVDKDLEGNIKSDGTKLHVESLGSSTEIDVLYISQYRVFPIEVKAYKAKQITLTDDSISGCYVTNKSPVHQNEMHCRHMYSHIFRALPDGKTDYIVPIVCFVDSATITDNRSPWQQDYIKISILDTLEDLIRLNNTPLDYKINLTTMNQILTEAKVSSEKYLPVRY